MTGPLASVVAPGTPAIAWSPPSTSRARRPRLHRARVPGRTNHRARPHAAAATRRPATTRASPADRAAAAALAGPAITLITNLGAANPPRPGERIRGLLEARPRRRGVLTATTCSAGLDPVAPACRRRAPLEVLGELVSANAYIGAEALLPALDRRPTSSWPAASPIPSLFVAPLADAFGWELDDWHLLGRGTVVGHLLECGAQLTGGYFADPGSRTCPTWPTSAALRGGRLRRLHRPQKLPGTGGRLDRAPSASSCSTRSATPPPISPLTSRPTSRRRAAPRRRRPGASPRRVGSCSAPSGSRSPSATAPVHRRGRDLLRRPWCLARAPLAGEIVCRGGGRQPSSVGVIGYDSLLGPSPRPRAFRSTPADGRSDPHRGRRRRVSEEVAALLNGRPAAAANASTPCGVGSGRRPSPARVPSPRLLHPVLTVPRVRHRPRAHRRQGQDQHVSLIPYDERWYAVLRDVVTAQLAAEDLQERYPGGVVRYEMENLSTLIFVLSAAPGRHRHDIAVSRRAREEPQLRAARA